MRALLIVDVQNDFLPGGALAVPEGEQVVPVLNRLIERFDLIVATQDWHPANHGSFAINHPGRKIGERIELDGLPQVLWPAHCVQGTPGAELAPALRQRRITRVIRKGTDPALDSYSGFFDNGRKNSTGLGAYLSQRQAAPVFIAGLATDYCVKYTALDARRLGFRTVLIEDACRGVELAPGDVARALKELQASGVEVVRSTEVVKA